VPGSRSRRTVGVVVPTELLVTAMIGAFAIALTAVLATVRLLASRIDDVRADVQDLRGDVNGVIHDDLTAVRASLGAIDARLTTLEQR